MTYQVKYTPLAGGMDLITPPTQLKPGRLIAAVNYECPITGGYRSVEGYTAYAAAPGSGPILGAAIYKGSEYCVRQNGASAKLYKLVGVVWVDVTGAAVLPVGRYECAAGNFKALSYSESMFIQCKDTGKPFMYDGTTLSELTNAPSGAKWVAVHHNHLFLGFANGSLQHSQPGDPTLWNAISGAGEIGIQDGITGLSSSKGVLIIGCSGSIRILYGTSALNWELKTYSQNTGVRPYSMADFNEPFFAHERGLTSLQAVQSFGDFSLGNWGLPIEPLFFGFGLVPVASCVSREKSQYRIFFNNKTGLYCTVVGGKVAITSIAFPVQVACIASGELASGDEVILFGDDAGGIYRLDSGTSFAGVEIESYLTTAFNHLGSPTALKRLRRLYLEVQTGGSATMSVLPQLDYGKAEISRHRRNFIDAIAAGGYWGVSDWSEFSWSSPVQDDHEVEIAGIATNFGLAIYHKSATDAPHTIAGYTTHYQPRRLRRG